MDNLILVGDAGRFINDDLLPTEIYRSDGLAVHICKNHTGCEKYIDYLPDIIEAPDYIGRSPRESSHSFELVKILDDNVQIGIKLDTNGDYWYVATLYTITDDKLNHRIESGRLKTYVP